MHEIKIIVNEEGQFHMEISEGLSDYAVMLALTNAMGAILTAKPDVPTEVEEEVEPESN